MDFLDNEQNPESRATQREAERGREGKRDSGGRKKFFRSGVGGNLGRLEAAIEKKREYFRQNLPVVWRTKRDIKEKEGL